MERTGKHHIGASDGSKGGDHDKSDLKLEQDIVDSLSSITHVTSWNDDPFPLGPQHNITVSDDSFSSDKEDVTRTNAKSNADRSEGEEDIKEEEDTKSQTTGSAGDRSRGIAGSRRARTRWWPPQSDPYHIYSSLQHRKVDLGEQVVTLGQGQDSGRNRMAIFQDADKTPRLAFNIRVEGRTGIQWKGYPSPRECFLPAGVSLSEILAQYPNHVWNDGLRLFMAENWLAESMWNGLPKDARNEGASTRKWNYLQQALGREADKVGQEQFGEKRVPDKRPKKDEPDSHQGDDKDKDDGDSSEKVNMSPAVLYARGAGGLQTASPSPGFPLSYSRTMTSESDVPGSYLSSLSQNVAVPVVGKVRVGGRAELDQRQKGRDEEFATPGRGGPAGLAYPDLFQLDFEQVSRKE